MTCVYKEYEVKIKMIQEEWLQLKMKFLLGYNMEIVIEGKIAFGGGNKDLVGGFFQAGVE